MSPIRSIRSVISTQASVTTSLDDLGMGQFVDALGDLARVPSQTSWASLSGYMTTSLPSTRSYFQGSS